LNDPILGVTALSRVGVQFNDQQKEQIRLMQESGNVLGAQKIILKELDDQVGGTAKGSADATAIMARSFDEVTESIGKGLMPAVQELTPVMVAMAETSIPVISLLARKVGELGTDAAAAATDIQKIVKAVGDYVDIDTEAVEETDLLGDAMGFLTKNVIGATWGFGRSIGTGLVGSVREFNEEMSAADEGAMRLNEDMSTSASTALEFAESMDEVSATSKEAGRYLGDEFAPVLTESVDKSISKIKELEQAFREFNEEAAKTNDPFGIWDTSKWGEMWGLIDDGTAAIASFNDVVAGFNIPSPGATVDSISEFERTNGIR